MTTLQQILKALGQAQLTVECALLSEVQQRALTAELLVVNRSLLQQQRQLVKNPSTSQSHPLEPCDNAFEAGSSADAERGRQLIREGACGCLLVAGGQGTRLGCDGPKGVVAVSAVKSKSLFQLIAERVLAAGKQVGRSLPLAVMTSSQNDRATREFFAVHRYFGLDPSQVSFFVQGSLPLLDERGDLFLDADDHLATGPDGNGSALAQFYGSGLWQRWREAGVRLVAFIQIDNALADPYDAELLGFHDRMGVEVTVKATRREVPTEKVGVLVRRSGKLQVSEYTEMDEVERLASSQDGPLKHPYANLSLFSFSMSFIQKAAGVALPLHLAYKAIKAKGGERMAWKFERFIFDVLLLADKSAVLVYPRDLCFAPLKNREGPDSLETVRRALQDFDRRAFSALAGVSLPNDSIEIAAQFHYPTQELAAKWRGHPPVKSGYIDA